MSRSLLVLLGLLSVSGCDAVESLLGEDDASEASPEPAPDAPGGPAGLEGYVVLEQGTSMFRRPSPEAPFLALHAGDGNTVQRYAAFEVLGNEGAWVQVRTLGPEDATAHCTMGWRTADPFDVRFWVRRSDLVPVTRHSVLARDARDSSVMLAAGTPLESASAEDGSPTHRLPELGIRVDVAKTSIAKTYRPGPVFGVRAPIAGRPLDALPLRFGSDDVDRRGLPLTTETPPRVAVFATQTKESDTFISTGSPCAELRVRDPGAQGWLRDAAPTADDLPPRWTTAPSPGGEGQRAKAGTALFWPDMESAGSLRVDHVFFGIPTKKSDKRCFEIGVGWSRLCVRADDLQPATAKEHEPPPPPPPSAPREEAPEIEEDEPPDAVDPELHEEPPEEIPPPEPTPAPATAPKAPVSPAGKTAGVAMSRRRVSSALDDAAAARVLKSHLPEVRRCYDKALARDASASGRMTLHLTVASVGAVKKAYVAGNTTSSPALAKCITAAAKHWGFAKPTGGGLGVVKLRYTFTP